MRADTYLGLVPKSRLATSWTFLNIVEKHALKGQTKSEQGQSDQIADSLCQLILYKRTDKYTCFVNIGSKLCPLIKVRLMVLHYVIINHPCTEKSFRSSVLIVSTQLPHHFGHRIFRPTRSLLLHTHDMVFW